MINDVAPSDAWKKNFRMSRKVFIDLVDQLRPCISPSPFSPNYHAINVEKKLGMTLYYLKDSGSLGMTANAFVVAIPTAAAIVYEVCSAISTHLGPKYLCLPKIQEEMRLKIAQFESKDGMIQCLGCVDGTQIPRKCPPENSQDYYCYKQFYSLNVQAICDCKGVFMDVECRWSGCVHDSKVVANSLIAKKLRD